MRSNIRDKDGVDAKLCRVLKELTFPLVDSIPNSDARVGKQLCAGALKAETHSWVMHRRELQRHVRAMFQKAAIHTNKDCIYVVYVTRNEIYVSSMALKRAWLAIASHTRVLQSRERIYCMCECVNRFSKSSDASSCVILRETSTADMYSKSLNTFRKKNNYNSNRIFLEFIIFGRLWPKYKLFFINHPRN